MSEIEIENGNQDGWSDTLREAHLALSPADLEFREFARRDPAYRQRSTFRVLDGDLRLYYRQQPWLTFIGPEKMADFKRVSLALADLIRSIPRRIFGNDAARICEFYHLPSPMATDIILSEPNCIAESMARGDLIDTADGFKCIEFNFTPNVGGWETSFLTDMHLGIPETAAFVERAGIRFTATPTLQVMFQHIIRQAQRTRLTERGELNVACAFDHDRLAQASMPPIMELFQRELDQALQEAGGTLRGKVAACHFSQLIPAQSRLFLGKTQMHVLLELGLGLAPAPIYRCFKAGNLLLYNGPVTEILTDKRNIALLWENQDSGLFSPEERETIRRHIPWSYLISARQVDFHGEEVFLPDLLRTHQDRLVLKEAKNYGGKGVVLGKFTARERWEEACRKALADGEWVVQERLESIPYLYQCGDAGCAPHEVIWGPFVFGDLYGGVILRMQPTAAGGAVNLSIAASQGIVLEV